MKMLKRPTGITFRLAIVLAAQAALAVMLLLSYKTADDCRFGARSLPSYLCARGENR